MNRTPVLHLAAAIALTTIGCAGPAFEEVNLDALSSICPEALETGDMTACNGTYHGVITIEASKGEMTSTCTGEMTVTIDSSSAVPVKGKGICLFDGLLERLGEQEGLIDGHLDTDLPAGELWVGEDLRTSWDGGWNFEGALLASFEGLTEAEGVELDYRGAFEVWKSE